MANNNYFTVAYKILSYLKYCYENSEDTDINVLQPGTFNIDQKQFLRTLKMLLDDGYITSVSLERTVNGPVVVNNIQNTEITSKGLQYLEENSMMKKVYKVLKEFRDWLPSI